MQNILQINCHDSFKLLGIANSFIINIVCVYLKFKVNDLKGVKVMGKINLQSESSPHIHPNLHTKLKVVVLIDYNYIGKAVTKI